MQVENLELIAQALSKDRLSAFYSKNKNSTLADRCSVYLWNNALSESLYNPLHFFEVTLRNALNREIRGYLNTENWFNNKELLRASEIKMVEDVLSRKMKKFASFNLMEVITRLPFGFWVNLFHHHYEGKLWPKLLKPVFPYIPRKMRVRQTIYKKFNKIRKLRNKVFHHEPIWHFSDLLQLHNEMLETIHWMSPSVNNLTNHITQFPKIYTNGYQPYWEILKIHLPTVNQYVDKAIHGYEKCNV